MTEPSERARQILAEEAIAEENNAAFSRLYNELDAFATRLGGKAWLNDNIYEVGSTRTRKVPTTHFGIESEDDFLTEYVEFTGKKIPIGDEEQHYCNVFYLSKTVSAPMQFEELDARYHSRLINYFLDNFPKLMHKHFKAMEEGADTEVMDDETADLDAMDTDDVVKICEKVLLDDVGEPLQRARRLQYAINESGVIECYEVDFCIMGLGEFTLSEFDSSTNYTVPVHGGYMDDSAEENVQRARDELSIPLRETIPEDSIEDILFEDEFDRLTSGVFGENDLGGKPFLKHAEIIHHMLRKLTT